MLSRLRLLYPLLWVILSIGLVQGRTSQSAVCGEASGGGASPSEALQRFATGLGIQYPVAFAQVVRYVDAQGALPPCYLTKEQALGMGWQPGADLWDRAPGKAIGGDRFGNLERRLPLTYNGQYLEADLDYAGGRRGAHRLIFVRDRPRSGLIWVTTDHYRTFHSVPRP